MLNWVKNALTERDNATFCPVRLGAFGTALVYHLAAAIGFFFHQLTLDMNTLGLYIQHMSLLGGAMAGGIGVKSLSKSDAQ